MIARIPRGPDIWAEPATRQDLAQTSQLFPWYAHVAILAPPAIGVVLIPVLGVASMAPSLFLLSLVLGWTVLVGPCGRAHTTALTPAGCIVGGRKHWLTNTSVYTVAGAISGAMVGAILGFAGSWIPKAAWQTWLLVGVAVLCAARELGVINWHLPEVRRQTRARWFMSGPSFLNPMMWALDVGLVFATWISFSGAWLLAVAVVLSGSPAFGAIVFAAYWIGRALPHWFEPRLQRHPRRTFEFSIYIAELYPQFRLIHALALLAFAIPLGWTLAS